LVDSALATNVLVEVVKIRKHSVLPEEDPSLDEPRKPNTSLILHVGPCGHTKDVVQLF
jgi:hypothetical protein